jgi:hypothetical protein
MTAERLRASFRDPNGFIFRQVGQLYRQINRPYADDYALLMESGLYESLVAARLLIPHNEVDIPAPEPDLADRVIQPEQLDFISYPYEWSFGQLKDAALATLTIQKRALAKGMSLKDSSAYNIQFSFNEGRPTLIDSLSFERYQPGLPWVAYRQFCQHFLAPLALMALKDVRLGQLLRVYIDGIPLDLCSQLLPGRTKLNVGLLTHIHAHAAAQKRFADQGTQVAATQGRQMSKQSLLGLIDTLERTVKALDWEPVGTEWADYTSDNNYSEAAMQEKGRLVDAYLDQVNPASVWDLGANTGFFSRLASAREIPTLSFDIDPGAVERSYRLVRGLRESYLLPLLQDLTNPSPDLGWQHHERDSLARRGPAGMVVALALIHHLAIANNVPLEQVADFFAALSPWLVIEFVPKSDSQVERLLASREDIFPSYTIEGFEAAFSQRYAIKSREAIPGSERTLFLLERI